MTTAYAFVTFLLGFVHIAIIATILITAFWAATKLFPSLGAWMNDTSDMVETDHERAIRIRESRNSYDQYV